MLLYELNFTNVNLGKSEFGNHLEVDIENTGERLLIPSVALELYNEAGESVGIFNADKKKTYPGTSVKFFVELNEVEAGNYQAVLLADCGEEEVFGVNISLEISND